MKTQLVPIAFPIPDHGRSLAYDDDNRTIRLIVHGSEYRVIRCTSRGHLERVASRARAWMLTGRQWEVAHER